MGLAALFFRLGGVKAMLWLSQGCMIIFVQLLEDVPRHGDFESSCDIIPCEADATVEVAILIHGELIFIFDELDEVLNVFLARVFYVEIINHEGEGDVADGVLPQAERLIAFKVPVGGKMFPQELVG